MKAYHKPVCCALLFLTAFPILVGCGKIDNPVADPKKGPNWTFLNYKVKNAEPGVDELKRISKKYSGCRIKILASSNLIPPAVFKEFSRATGVDVDIHAVITPDEIPERLADGKEVDLILGPGHVVQRLIAEHRLKALNHQNIANLDRIDRRFATNFFDPGQHYSVPYFWSYAGIAYNRLYFDHPPRTWLDVLSPRTELHGLLDHRISLLPGPQRALAAALIHHQSSPNTDDPKEILVAGQLLLTNATTWRYRYLLDGLPKAMASKEVLIAQCYSSDAAVAARRDFHIDFALPEDGTWLTIDSFAIPSAVDCRKQEITERFIGFLLEPRIAGEVVNHSLRASTVSGARAFVDSEERNGAVYVHPDKKHPMYYQFYEQDSYALREQIWQSLSNLSKTAQPATAPSQR